MKFRFKGEEIEYEVTDTKTNKDGTIALFSKDYACGIFGVIEGEDEIEVIK